MKFLVGSFFTVFLVSACGTNSQSKTASEGNLSPALGNVTVVVSNGVTTALIAGGQATIFRKSLKHATYSSPEGGLKIDCSAAGGSCSISVVSSSADLSKVSHPGPANDYLSFHLIGDIAKDLYLNQTSSEEKLQYSIGDRQQFVEYKKEILSADDVHGDVTIECFKNVDNTHTSSISTYECRSSLNSF